MPFINKVTVESLQEIWKSDLKSLNGGENRSTADEELVQSVIKSAGKSEADRLRLGFYRTRVENRRSGVELERRGLDHSFTAGTQ